MADFYGGIVDGSWRCWVGAWVVQENDGAALVRSVTRFQCVNNWTLQQINANFGATVAGQTASSSTVNGINVGTNGSQDIASKDVWVNKGHGAQNVGVSGYINVWGFMAGSSSASGSVAINGKPSHTVSYNANGGTGAPGNQTKWYGEQLFISSTRPTRKNYLFQGWATSPGGSVSYQPGQQYAPDQNITLYAVWKLAFVNPHISGLWASRCDKDGKTSNEGEYTRIVCNWSVDTKVDAGNTGQKIKASVKPLDTSGTPATSEGTLTGTSGSWTKIMPGISVGSSYSITVTVTDKHTNATATTTVTAGVFILDIHPGGKGIGIGRAAPANGVSIRGDTITITDKTGTWIFKNGTFVKQQATLKEET